MRNVVKILIVLTVFGCSSNLEEEMVATNVVVGTWKLTSITTMGQNFINDCKSKDKIEVRANKTFTITNHFEDNNCEIQTSSGTWSDNLNSTYKFIAAGDIQTFTLTTDNLLTFSFQQGSETIVYSYQK